MNNAETFVEEVGELEDELFVDDVARVDPAPRIRKSSGKKRRKKGARASERRSRPEDAGGTNTALNQGGKRPSTDRLNLAAGVLTCTRGPEEGLALSLIEGSYTIGRGKDNNFVLKDLAASRKHVRVVVSNNKVTLEDLGSGNGTRVNSQTIGKHHLKDGDRIEIGDSELYFTYVGNDRSIEASALSTDPSERIAKAAEQLAAELSDKLKHDDYDVDTHNEANSAASFMAEQADLVEDVLSNSSNKNAPVRADQLWQETATRLPLSDVVAGNQPLAVEEPTGTMMPQSLIASNTGTPSFAPQAHRQPTYAQPRQAMGVVAQEQPRSGAAALWLLALVTVLLVAAIVVGGWWLLRDGGIGGGPTVDPFNSQMALATSSINEKQYEAAKLAIERALIERPGDPIATNLLEMVQSELARPVAEVPKEEPVDEPEPVVDEPDPVEDEPEPVVEEPDPVVDEPEPKVRPKATPRPKVTPKPRPKPTPKPRATPKPKPAAASGMSDSDAKGAYVKAMRLVRGDDESRGCDLIGKVAREAPSDSAWRAKAKNALERYGCE